MTCNSLGEHGSEVLGGAEGPGEREKSQTQPRARGAEGDLDRTRLLSVSVLSPNTHVDTSLLTMGLLPEAGEELHFTHSAPSWAQAALLQGPLAKQKPEDHPPLPFPDIIMNLVFIILSKFM